MHLKLPGNKTFQISPPPTQVFSIMHIKYFTILGGATSAQVELNKKREAEINK